MLGAALFGTAGRRPNLGCGPRAAPEAALHNVTKPHRPRTYRDAGRERALRAASQSTRQAGASTSRRHWLWTLIVTGLKWTGGGVQPRDNHADVGHGRANSFIHNSDHRSMGTDHHQVAVSVRSRKQQNERYEERDSNIAVDLTETIEEETVNHP